MIDDEAIITIVDAVNGKLSVMVPAIVSGPIAGGIYNDALLHGEHDVLVRRPTEHDVRLARVVGGCGIAVQQLCDSRSAGHHAMCDIGIPPSCRRKRRSQRAQETKKAWTVIVLECNILPT